MPCAAELIESVALATEFDTRLVVASIRLPTVSRFVVVVVVGEAGVGSVVELAYPVSRVESVDADEVRVLLQPASAMAATRAENSSVFFMGG
jgi:hypothetical protein